MHRQQRVTVELAVQILRTAMLNSAAGPVNTVPVRLALRTLWTHCPERWPLVMFWDSSIQANEIGRQQGVTASFNGIICQLRRSGAWTDVPTQESHNSAPGAINQGEWDKADERGRKRLVQRAPGMS